MPVVHSLYRESGTTVVNQNLCTTCGQCVQTCPAKVLNLVDGQVRQDDVGFGCIACGHCMMVCPTGSITVHGRRFGPEDLMDLPPSTERAGAEQFDALVLGRVVGFGQRLELDGQAGIQELAGNATLLYYMSEEAQEGKKAYVEKRKPQFRKFKWLPW